MDILTYAILKKKIEEGGGGSGKPGKDGRGIKDIVLKESIDNKDTYIITYTDNTTSEFVVTNGIDGAKGEPGAEGPQGPAGVTNIQPPYSLQIIPGTGDQKPTISQEQYNYIKAHKEAILEVDATLLGANKKFYCYLIIEDLVNDILYYGVQEDLDYYEKPTTKTIFKDTEVQLAITNKAELIAAYTFKPTDIAIRSIHGQGNENSIGLYFADGIVSPGVEFKTINNQSIFGIGNIEAGGSKVIELAITPTSQSAGTISQEQYDFIINNLDCIIKIDGTAFGLSGAYAIGRIDRYIKDEIYGDGVNSTMIIQSGSNISSAYVEIGKNEQGQCVVEWGFKDFDEYTVKQATETQLGGVKASPKTDDDTQEVHIDTASGKLFTKAGAAGENGQDGKDGVDGTNGADGKDGRGITTIEKTNTQGLVDTYTITYSDNLNPTTFTVTNGKDGETQPQKPDEIAHEGTNKAACVNKTEYIDTDGTVKQILFKELADCKIIIFDGFKYGDGANGVDLHLAFDPYILKHSYQLRVIASGQNGWTTDVILKYAGDDKPITWETVTDWSSNKQFGVTKITKHY